ncbi:hypothetical protein [Zoogloea sp.]
MPNTVKALKATGASMISVRESVSLTIPPGRRMLTMPVAVADLA